MPAYNRTNSGVANPSGSTSHRHGGMRPNRFVALSSTPAGRWLEDIVGFYTVSLYPHAGCIDSPCADMTSKENPVASPEPVPHGAAPSCSRVDRRRAIIIAFLTGSLALLALTNVTALLPLSLAAIVVFISGTALSASLDASLGDLALPGQRARVIGRYTTFHDLGSTCGPLLGYALGVWLGLGLMYGLGRGIFVASAGFYGWTFGQASLFDQDRLGPRNL